jgi:uncharacterized Fe-S radical SAM superfamily protein PflX
LHRIQIKERFPALLEQAGMEVHLWEELPLSPSESLAFESCFLLATR